MADRLVPPSSSRSARLAAEGVEARALPIIAPPPAQEAGAAAGLFDAATSELERTAIWKDRWALLWRLRLSSAYHAKRVRFYERCDKWTKAISVIGGASAVSALLASSQAKAIGAAVGAAVSLFSLVFGFSTKAVKHAGLVREFRRLEADLLEVARFTPQTCPAFEARAVRLEAEEPMPLGALLADVHNELALAVGAADVIALKWYQRLLKHVVAFDPVTLRRAAMKEAPAPPL
jgi:hypothetical protein